MGAKNPRSLTRVVTQLLLSDEIRLTEFMRRVERSRKTADSDQGLTAGLRNKLKAMAARNSTLSNSTAHRPSFFQSVP